MTILTLTEAAAFLKMSPRALKAHGQKVPRHRLPCSNRWRYVKEELEAWVTGKDVLEIPIRHRRKMYEA